MLIEREQIHDQDLIIEAIENNIREKLCYIPKRHPDMEVLTHNTISFVDSSLPSDTFNTVFVGRIDAESAQCIFDFYSKIQSPCAWWLGPSSESSMSTDCLTKAGFRHDEHDVGMVCDLGAHDFRVHLPEAIDIKLCRSAQDFCDFGRVLASIFEPSPEALEVERYYRMINAVPAEQRNDLQLFVAYLNGLAVSTAGLFLSDCAGIFDISTHPSFRRQGLGSLVFQYAVQQAVVQGYAIAVLQASAESFAIYEHCGFRALADFNVWSNVSR